MKVRATHTIDGKPVYVENEYIYAPGKTGGRSLLSFATASPYTSIRAIKGKGPMIEIKKGMFDE